MPSTLRCEHQLLRLAIEVISARIEIGGQLETGRRFRGVGRRVFQHDGHRDVRHVERQPVAEQQDQHHRQHDADGDAAGIANDLPAFLAHERRDAAEFRGKPAVLGCDAGFIAELTMSMQLPLRDGISDSGLTAC